MEAEDEEKRQDDRIGNVRSNDIFRMFRTDREEAENQEKTDSGKETSGELVYEENETGSGSGCSSLFLCAECAWRQKIIRLCPGRDACFKGRKIVLKKAYGVQQAFDWSSGKESFWKILFRWRQNTLIDLASCTKISATTQAVMKLVTEGRLDVKEKVASYLPEFAQNGKENVTVEELLTHTSGLPQWRPMFLYCDTKEEVLEYICSTGLMFEPGEYYYSDLGFMTLGFLVER